jgi:MFS superfamily sulfate permease-like transporter
MKITVNKSARGQGGAAPSPFLERLQSMVSAWKADWARCLSISPSFPTYFGAVTVAAVAMPLNLALAVASGLPPAAGLFSGAIGGFIAAAFGGQSAASHRTRRRTIC